jgi:hypothetical protein
MRKSGVGVAVGVLVGVGVRVGVRVNVGVIVGEFVGVGVGGSVIVVVACDSLFVSSASATAPNGSTVAVFTTVPAVGTKPTTVIVAEPPGPSVPRLQSSVPPVSEATIAQFP